MLTPLRIEISLLGPFQVRIGATSAAPTASKPRQLLALLALNAGREVSTAALLEEIWEHDPPRSAMTTIQTYVLHLRRLLDVGLAGTGSSAKDVLVTGRAGYRLDVPVEHVDAHRYLRHSTAGRRAGDAGDPAAASRQLGAALSAWRGEALQDVACGPRLGVELVRLEESRVSDLDLRIDADLRLGRHHQLLGELAALVARYPLHENFHAQYMLALYRSGRQGRALEVFRTLRDNEATQLGVDPSRRMRALHRAMLAGDPSIDDPAFVTSAWVPARAAG